MKTSHLPKIKCTACDGTGKVPDLSAIGRERRAAREKAGIKATPLAAKMGIPKSTLWDLETGRRGVWTDELLKAHADGVAELAKAKADKKAAASKQKVGPREKAKAKKREAAARASLAHDPTIRTKSGNPKRGRKAALSKGLRLGSKKVRK